MDLQNLKTFMCVAELENFSKAAEELNYAQSTVTAQIKQLEKELGFPLFERVGRRSYLTAGGREFLSYAIRIRQLLDKAGTIGEDIKSAKGVIRIGVLESLLHERLLPVLADLQGEFQELEIMVKMGQTHELLSLMKQNQLDVIYVSNAANTDASVKTLYKRREELVFVSGKGHPVDEKCSIEELFSYRFVTTEPGGYCFGRLGEIASSRSLELHHKITVDSVNAIITLLSDNRSIAFLPKYSITDDMKIIDPGIPPCIYYSQLLCPKDKWISPFMKYMTERIEVLYPGMPFK